MSSVPASYVSIQRELTDAIAAGGELATLARHAMQQLAELASEQAREIEVQFDTFASEWGREGESHALWDRRALPVFHQRAGEAASRREDPGFLRRVTLGSSHACRSLVVDETGGWNVIYWTASARTTEHGSERAFAAVGVTSLSIDRALGLIDPALLARSLAGQPLAVDGAWQPPAVPHIAPPGDRDREQPLFQLQFPPGGACFRLDRAGRGIWGSVPTCGYRFHEYSGEAMDIDAEPEPEPKAEPEPNTDSDLDALAVPLPRDEVQPLGRQSIEPVASPPAPWS